MAQRRMFSPDIVESEEFVSMPVSSQALYFHLGMWADDDGFIQPKRVMRAIGFTDDDLKVLIYKRFLLPFESGVVVVKHWLIHNMIRCDRYKETRFIKEKGTLYLKENKAYTDNESSGMTRLATKWQPDGNHLATQVRLGKVRLGKDIDTPPKVVVGEKDFLTFWDEYPKKIGKGAALRSWSRLRPSKELAARIITSVREHKPSRDWQKDHGQFIPLPATYLNQGRYDDEVQQSASSVIKI